VSLEKILITYLHTLFSAYRNSKLLGGRRGGGNMTLFTDKNNADFGGCKKERKNVLFTKFRDKLNRNVIGIG
jgi:hypothetical protein